jgi:hypothetical protein
MAAATQTAHGREPGARLGKGADYARSGILDTRRRSSTACQLERALREKIVGQEEAALRRVPNSQTTGDCTSASG